MIAVNWIDAAYTAINIVQALCLGTLIALIVTGIWFTIDQARTDRAATRAAERRAHVAEHPSNVIPFRPRPTVFDWDTEGCA